MILKYIAIVFIMLFVAGCGSDDSETAINTTNNNAQSGLTAFENSDFLIGVPAAWTVIDDIESLLPTPNNGVIELAATSVDTQNGFANNILILSQDLNQTTTSQDFSLLNHIGVEREYSEYVGLDKQEITLDSETTLLYVFEARYNLDTPKLKFVQSAAVCGTKGYLFTIALPTSITDTSKYEDILKTFSCK